MRDQRSTDTAIPKMMKRMEGKMRDVFSNQTSYGTETERRGCALLTLLDESEFGDARQTTRTAALAPRRRGHCDSGT